MNMVDEVDAAMIMDFDRSYELAEPFLRKRMLIKKISNIKYPISNIELKKHYEEGYSNEQT
jgi:hypothetical protein